MKKLLLATALITATFTAKAWHDVPTTPWTVEEDENGALMAYSPITENENSYVYMNARGTLFVDLKSGSCDSLDEGKAKLFMGDQPINFDSWCDQGSFVVRAASRAGQIFIMKNLAKKDIVTFSPIEGSDSGFVISAKGYIKASAEYNKQRTKPTSGKEAI